MFHHDLFEPSSDKGGIEKKRHFTEKKQAKLRKLDMKRQYARLCALGDVKNYKERYEKGLADFAYLISIDGVLHIGIDWQEQALLIGTEFIEVPDEACNVRQIGHIIVTMRHSPACYSIQNATHTIGNAGGATYAHPHAIEGKELCMHNGNMAVKVAITDGQYSIAASIILTALRMRNDSVSRGSAYSGAELYLWPIKGEKT